MCLRRCKFPFDWNGISHKRCTHSTTPSHSNPVCKQFEKDSTAGSSDGGGEAGIYYDQTEFKGIQIKGGNGTQTCYKTKPGKYGWCGENPVKFYQASSSKVSSFLGAALVTTAPKFVPARRAAKIGAGATDFVGPKSREPKTRKSSRKRSCRR